SVGIPGDLRRLWADFPAAVPATLMSLNPGFPGDLSDSLDDPASSNFSCNGEAFPYRHSFSIRRQYYSRDAATT
ncbi:MAG TPA: hypothetical protein VNI35_01050, partial [Nitrospira sp.]|nr:hypothetical protein [Nitrospira sp.]